MSQPSVDTPRRSLTSFPLVLGLQADNEIININIKQTNTQGIWARLDVVDKDEGWNVGTGVVPCYQTHWLIFWTLVIVKRKNRRRKTKVLSVHLLFNANNSNAYWWSGSQWLFIKCFVRRSIQTQLSNMQTNQC